ncbi:uncharacterized protein BJ212DRAFT_1526349 [Suillus subaureus]|uniref:Uncharacterized protein n=1 Tax=Suillus subaureus TaxID=48587 RepID=A0A9P7DJD4_9AGAM|nr:uncharacterized protein BJ212DRAFT_1526349 [Suillus subaureus]KAG1795546.1 hypothetical protein BJ212DRAFT_1526349 [Suillus subaureus]
MPPLHTSSVLQKLGHISVPLVAASAGMAEIGDEAEAAMTTRTIAEEKRIICDSCATGSDNSGAYTVDWATKALGEPRQTREHILRDRPLFTCQHIYLHEVSHDIRDLGTEKGIEALTKVIQESDAFKKVALLGQARDCER